MFTVEKDVPLPIRLKGKRSAYPWETMEVGDSFYCSKETASPSSVRQSMTTANKRAAGSRLFVSLVDDNGIRVWRKV